MKRNLLIALLLLSSAIGLAQNSGITYQAVIYAPGGEALPGINNEMAPMVNRSVCLRFSILDASQTVEYQEVIRTTTDHFGMVNLTIGSDDQTGGYANGFMDISWELFDKYLQVELDAKGYCSSFEVINSESIKYVPLAYSALNAENVSGIVNIENGGTSATSVVEAKVNFGLDQVDNTSDVNKPISNATQEALDTLQADVDQNEADADAAIAAVQADVDQNEADADAAIAVVQADVDQNEADADAAIAAVQADVDQNEADADAAIAAVQADVDQNEADADAAIAAVQADVDQNEADADAAIAAIQADVDQNEADADEAIAAVQADVDQNEADADAAIAAVQADVDQNEADADAAIAALQADVDQNEADADAAIAALQADVDQNEADADTAIAALQDELDATQAGAGLNPDGTYTPIYGTYFIKDANSLAEATEILDARVRVNQRNIYKKAQESEEALETLQVKISDSLVNLFSDQTIAGSKSFNNTVSASGFKTPTGTSTEYLMADGSVSSLDSSDFGPFSTTSNVTSNSNGTLATDDFVFGSTSLDDVPGTDDDARMFFDKSKRAFRAGYTRGTEWDDANVGENSTAMGWTSTASGRFSFSMGLFTRALGNASIAMGSNTTASGYASTAMGESTTAPSYGETAIGSFNTRYTPASATSWDASDRLFVIGNGRIDGEDSDALVMLKNGNTTMSGTVTAPGFKTPSGTSTEYLMADGSVSGSPTYTIGLWPELGGYVFWVSSDGKHGLVAETVNQGGSNWYEAQDLISNPSNHSVDGQKFRDWRLPTRYELSEMYLHKEGIGGLTNGYWSSTEGNSNFSWLLNFSGIDDGNEYLTDKDSTGRVRAVRAF